MTTALTCSEIRRWQTLQQQLTVSGQRRLVVVEGPRMGSLAWLQSLLPALSPVAGVWTGPATDCPLSGLQVASPGAGRSWLGRELDLLVWDGWQGNPPDSLAAFAGTLKAGGLLFWLMPPLKDWPHFADPDYVRTGLADNAQHPAAARWARVLTSDAGVIRIRPGETSAQQLPVLAPPATPFSVTASEDQRVLVDALVRLGQGHRRRPLVITADRGRGKSAALGIAAVRLLQAGRRHIAVTAPVPETVHTLFRHARLAADQPDDPRNPLAPVVLADGARLQFWPIDRLLDERPEAELVLVDEAAAIPAPLLKSVLLGWPRIAYATTVHGYEGSGRGFAIRFRAELDRHTPKWRGISLSQPIRWAVGDPLEATVRRLFLLDAESPGTLPADGQISLTRWQPSEVGEGSLSEAFGLLVDAHYRTSPGDLRQWLDDPGSVTWLLRQGERVAGVLWAAEEGGIAPHLAEQIMMGRRRIRGHLLPQSLACHSGEAEAATLRLLRIVRVAVHPDLRCRGFGRRLVAAAESHAKAAGLDGVGTSFGGSESLVRFWQHCQLPLVRVGLHREASSGEYPIQMLRGLSPAGQRLVERLQQRFGRHWPVLLPQVWSELEPRLALLLTALLPVAEALAPEDHRDLTGFTEGYRGFELSLPVLRQLSGQRGVARGLLQQANRDGELWSRAVLQGWPWSRLQGGGHCLGRKDGEGRLRALAAQFL